MLGALLSAIMLAAACYQPAIPAGGRCSQSGDCPGGEPCIEGVCGGDGPDLPDLPDAPPGSTVFVAGADRSQLRDTELWGMYPNANYGDQDHFSVDDEELGLVWFDLSGAPAGLAVVKATLKLITTDDASEDGGTVLVYRMLESWTEADATWQMRTASQAWTAPGAGPPSRQSSPLAEVRPDQEVEPFEVALPVEVVREWLADPASNFGIAIVRGTSMQHVHMATRETIAWSTLTLELRP